MEVASMTKTIKAPILFVAMLGFLTVLFSWSAPLLAQGTLQAIDPLATSTDEYVHMDETFKQPSERVPLTKTFKDWLKETPSFFRDTKLNINLRTFDFYRD
jgi:hypothetical protein